MSQTTHHAIKFQRVTYRRDSSGKYHQSVAENVIICPIDQGLGDVIYGLSYQPILDLYCVKDHPDNLVEFLFVVSDHPFSYAWWVKLWNRVNDTTVDGGSFLYGTGETFFKQNGGSTGALDFAFGYCYMMGGTTGVVTYLYRKHGNVLPAVIACAIFAGLFTTLGFTLVV